MANGNPFYIQPANFMPGVQAATQGAIEGKLEQKKRGALNEFSKNFDKMSPKQIAQFALQNPDVAEQIIQGSNIERKLSRDENLSQAWDVIANPDKASEILFNRAEQILERGGDATETIQLAKDALQGGDTAIKSAYAFAASNDTDAFKAWMSAQQSGKADEVPERKMTELREFADNAVAVFKSKNPNAGPAKVKEVWNNAFLRGKRPQAPEVASTTRAKEEVETEFAKEKNYQTEIGKRLAEIETATPLIHAEGKLTEAEKKLKAKQSVTSKLAELGGYYAELDQLGALINAEDAPIDNLIATARASGLGQYIERTFGTDAQSVRDSIRSMKPLLLNDIRQSTDMGSRGLDSEKELEFYLQAATDEQRSLQANKAAMIVLDEAYGDGRIAQQLRQTEIDMDALQEIAQQGRLIANGALLTKEEREKRRRKGRTPLQPSNYVPQVSGRPEGRQQPQQQQYPEGTIIENAAGQRMIMRNGNWEAM